MPPAQDLFLIVVAVMNVITFFAFGVDKRRARLGRSRIPESRLLGLTFATGLIGGWVGMSVFRHKTKKTSFQLKMVLCSVFNLAWLVIGLWVYLGR